MAFEDCVGSRNKFLDTYFETIEGRLISNYGEFAIIKTGIIDFLPNADIFKCIAVTLMKIYEGARHIVSSTF